MGEVKQLKGYATFHWFCLSCFSYYQDVAGNLIQYLDVFQIVFKMGLVE